jgi:TM2 domain-containing membrane protein YozV
LCKGSRLPLPVPAGYESPLQQQYGVRQYYHTVQPRNAALAVIASLFIPGLGSMINGKAGKGVLILCCYIVAAISCLFLIGFILAPAVWIWGMVAGYQDATKWNREHGILS